MKLYATTVSERAKKGQGGNDKLQIILQVEKNNKQRKIIANVYLFNDKENDQYILTLVPLMVQEYADENGKSIVLTNKTRRWCCSKD